MRMTLIIGLWNLGLNQRHTEISKSSYVSIGSLNDDVCHFQDFEAIHNFIGKRQRIDRRPARRSDGKRFLPEG